MKIVRLPHPSTRGLSYEHRTWTPSLSFQLPSPIIRYTSYLSKSLRRSLPSLTLRSLHFSKRWAFGRQYRVLITTTKNIRFFCTLTNIPNYSLTKEHIDDNYNSANLLFVITFRMSQVSDPMLVGWEGIRSGPGGWGYWVTVNNTYGSSPPFFYTSALQCDPQQSTG